VAEIAELVKEYYTTLFSKQYIFWVKIILTFLAGKGVKLLGCQC